MKTGDENEERKASADTLGEAFAPMAPLEVCLSWGITPLVNFPSLVMTSFVHDTTLGQRHVGFFVTTSDQPFHLPGLTTIRPAWLVLHCG